MWATLLALLGQLAADHGRRRLRKYGADHERRRGGYSGQPEEKSDGGGGKRHLSSAQSEYLVAQGV
jgi:tRNA U34 5-methylaminomethyl-2-thiouridine-forming methyltransferase MnmC